MNPWGALIGAAIGGGAGMFKAQEDQRRYMEQKNEQAAKARLSPWTRIAVGDPGGRPGQVGTVAQGVAAGGQMGSGMGGMGGGSSMSPQTGDQSMAANNPNKLNTNRYSDNAYTMMG